MQTAGRCNLLDYRFVVDVLFLPCKQQADATAMENVDANASCFYLANSRQMQRT
ncbi:hypothetical protein PI172_2268 [Prevotella intermedia]|uniref:Uncharacterized protein n=1 Tax=Prevotella intermedia TaxID=28131 RepID=A0AAD1F8I8_PREIN|nr:hypothetical protein PI172_2268 [Prevotella intermedia]